MPDCQSLFLDLEKTLLTDFLPSVFGCEVSELEQQLFSLPVRFGGLGVSLPTSSTESMYMASHSATSLIVSAIVVSRKVLHSIQVSNYDLVLNDQHHYQLEHDSHCKTLFSSVLASVLAKLDPIHKRANQRAKDKDLSVWLTALQITLISLLKSSVMLWLFIIESLFWPFLQVVMVAVPHLAWTTFCHVERVVLLSYGTMNCVMLWEICLTCCGGM